MKLVRLCIFTLSALVCLGARGADDNNRSTVPLRYGQNVIALPDRNVTMLATFSHRANFNAHGFDVLTLVARSETSDSRFQDFSTVTLFDGDKETLALTTGGGADCLLHDLRLLKDHSRFGLSMIVAKRDVGMSFVDSQPVLFSYYTLRKNATELPGRPLYYFELTKQTETKNSYCDVGDAFRQELGLTPYR